MRLDKYLADMSIGTRSEVKEIIKKKRIKVNGNLVTKFDYNISGEDQVNLDEKLIEYIDFEYYLLYKPSGYICALEDKHTPVIMELIKSKRKDLVPVGRLDKDTEGAILITNDGNLNHQLLSPKHHVLKTYYVEVDNDLNKDNEIIFSRPIQFEDFTSKPAYEYKKLSNNTALLTISEGKYHQVKRMFKYTGSEVTYLKRIKFGSLTLDGLNKGEYRSLTKQEVADLKNLIK